MLVHECQVANLRITAWYQNNSTGGLESCSGTHTSLWMLKAGIRTKDSKYWRDKSFRWPPWAAPCPHWRTRLPQHHWWEFLVPGKGKPKPRTIWASLHTGHLQTGSCQVMTSQRAISKPKENRETKHDQFPFFCAPLFPENSGNFLMIAWFHSTELSYDGPQRWCLTWDFLLCLSELESSREHRHTCRFQLLWHIYYIHFPVCYRIDSLCFFS